MTMRAALFTPLPLLAVAAGCQSPPEVPLHPTWADVQPILNGECNHCHGATAAKTGALGPAVYRFDFYDMSDEACGDASSAVDVPALAAASAGRMVAALSGSPPRMPPAPARPLYDWERDTILRWAEQPIKGPAPPGNHRPRIRVNNLPAAVSKNLSFIATIEDTDGDPVIGVLRLGELSYRMGHPGSFAVNFDMTGVLRGPHRLTAVLCDGWYNATIDLGPIDVNP
jgi:hypothetical protein